MRNNPIKSAITTIASVAAVVVFFWAIEDRYVSAADFQKFQQWQVEQMERQTKKYDNSITSFRRQLLEDELFELQLKAENGTITPVERAKLLRIQRQLRSLD